MDVQKEKCDYLKKIIEFNSDKDIIALSAKYKEPTFFEIISKQRSETTYSSFLKWMFQLSSTDMGVVSPLLLLLDVLVFNDKNGLIDNDLKKHIVTRNFKINNIEIDAEKPVNTLVYDLKINETNNCAGLKENEIHQIAAKCKDRIDLFINCEIELEGINKQVQIIIENKIDSNEAKSKKNKTTEVETYDKAFQTERYYIATALRSEYANEQNIIQIYTYLAPSHTDDCKCDKYIRINYQDIVDSIITPMLASSALSKREVFFFEELKTELTFPSLESSNVRNSIATSVENIEKFIQIWGIYKYLICDAAISAMQSQILHLGNKYMLEEPKIEDYILECLKQNESETIKQEHFINKKASWKHCVEYNGRKLPYNSQKTKEIKVFAKNIGADIGIIDYSEEDKDILNAFWDNNQRFLLALIDAIKDSTEIEEEDRKILCKLSEDSTKRDRTKYRVYYNKECLNDLWLSNKSANNAETAWLIIKAWAEKEHTKVTIGNLRKKFTPDNSNTYYKNRKWLKELFYEYNKEGVYTSDGDENGGISVNAGGWDFYKPNTPDDKKFRISTKEGDDYAIMLKMWRKDGLQKLIELVTDPDPEKKYFKEGELIVQPDK